jgi:hypothetical protein
LSTASFRLFVFVEVCLFEKEGKCERIRKDTGNGRENVGKIYAKYICEKGKYLQRGVNISKKGKAKRKIGLWGVKNVISQDRGNYYCGRGGGIWLWKNVVYWISAGMQYVILNLLRHDGSFLNYV